MNYKRKKNLLIIRWLKKVLSSFDVFVICYVKPLTKERSFDLRKNLKNIKIVPGSSVKSYFFFENMVSLNFFNGKLAVCYFKHEDDILIRHFLESIEKQKLLVPLLFYRYNRFLKVDEKSFKHQLTDLVGADVTTVASRINFVSLVWFRCIKSQSQKMFNLIKYLSKNEK
jgi:ribosomal protein L10